jgi:hypothetical protein
MIVQRDDICHFGVWLSVLLKSDSDTPRGKNSELKSANEATGQRIPRFLAVRSQTAHDCQHCEWIVAAKLRLKLVLLEDDRRAEKHGNGDISTLFECLMIWVFSNVL